MSYCTLGDNISSLNTIDVEQLIPIKPLVPLQLINDERLNISFVTFILPTAHVSQSPPQNTDANVDINNGAQYTQITFKVQFNPLMQTRHGVCLLISV